VIDIGDLVVSHGEISLSDINDVGRHQHCAVRIRAIGSFNVLLCHFDLFYVQVHDLFVLVD
jgi:hypothetical protein